MDYNTHPVWGADYRRAVANGDTAYAQKLQRAMDASPQAADTAGQVMANTLEMGRGGDTWANGADGHQVNTQGQIRVAQAAVNNLLPGTGGNLYRMNPAASGTPAASQIIGQAAPTVTQDQFAAGTGATDPYSTNPSWGADYRNAVARGDTALAQRYRDIIDRGAPDFSQHTLNAAGQSNYNPANPANTTLPANYNPATGGPRSNSPTGEVAAPHGVTPIPKASVETGGGVPQANPFTTQAARIARAQSNANAPRLYTGNFQRPTGLASQPNLYSGLKFK